jgi:CBS domain containing-hemolysin-like protein
VPDEGPYETLGGLLMARLGRIPTEGDSVEVDGVLLQVERMAGRRVERLRVVSLDDGLDAAAPDGRGERA